MRIYTGADRPVTDMVTSVLVRIGWLSLWEGVKAAWMMKRTGSNFGGHQDGDFNKALTSRRSRP
jgi:hypothetical protein